MPPPTPAAERVSQILGGIASQARRRRGLIWTAGLTAVGLSWLAAPPPHPCRTSRLVRAGRVCPVRDSDLRATSNTHSRLESSTLQISSGELQRLRPATHTVRPGRPGAIELPHAERQPPLVDPWLHPAQTVCCPRCPIRAAPTYRVRHPCAVTPTRGQPWSDNPRVGDHVDLPRP